jgi:hypothetical protein
VALTVTVAGGGAAARLCMQEATNKSNAERRIIRRRDSRAAARAASAIANAPRAASPLSVYLVQSRILDALRVSLKSGFEGPVLEKSTAIANDGP